MQASFWDFVPAALLVALYLIWLGSEVRKDKEEDRKKRQQDPDLLRREIWYYIRQEVALSGEEKLELASLAMYMQANGTDLQGLQRLASVLRNRAQDQGVKLFLEDG